MKLKTLFMAVLIALALVPLAAGCSPKASGTGTPVNLDGTSWTLVHLQGKDLLPDTEATLAFEGDQIAGTASCNRYFGGATIKDDTITFGMIGSTEMWCGEPEGLMTQETDYLKALGSVARYSVENGELTLLGADGEALLVFVPSAD